MSVLGLPELDSAHTPTLATSQGDTIRTTTTTGESLLDVLFETNPLDGQCDTRIRLDARPLEITFDAVCIKTENSNAAVNTAT